MSKSSRRNFLKTGASALGAGMMLPVINRTAMGSTIVQQLENIEAGNGNILVIVELAGGVDGLNTIVPITQYDLYASFRTRVAIPKDQILPLNGSTTMGLAPQLSALKPIADAGKFAVVQASHYPNPNLSHDSSRVIYYLGNPNANTSTSKVGWIGRHAQLYGSKTNSLDMVGIGGVGPTLYASGVKVCGIGADNSGNATNYQFNADTQYPGDAANQLWAAQAMDAATATTPYTELVEATETDAFNSSSQVAAATAAYTSTITYPANDGFANGLKLIAKLATSTNPNLGTRVYYISIGGFDTHANQTTDLPALLQRVGNGLKAFYDDLAAHNLQDRTMVMVWSEFGRRVADNASSGTDHGTCNNILLLGGKVKGGVYGADPSLTNLSNGNLVANLDFRQTYATIIDNWLGGDSVQVLNGSFSKLGFI